MYSWWSIIQKVSHVSRDRSLKLTFWTTRDWQITRARAGQRVALADTPTRTKVYVHLLCVQFTFQINISIEEFVRRYTVPASIEFATVWFKQMCFQYMKYRLLFLVFFFLFLFYNRSSFKRKKVATHRWWPCKFIFPSISGREPEAACCCS